MKQGPGLAAASIAFAISLLAGCGGGGKADVSGTDAQVVADVSSSNIQSWSGGNSGTNRWVGAANSVVQVAVHVPAPANAVETDLAAKARVAIATINRRLTGLVLLSEVGVAPASGGYFRVSYLTSYVPPGSTDYSSYCSNVATGPNVGNVVGPTSPSGERNQKVAWVNLGNGRCDVTQDIVVHEMGHALGLANHFQGFGFPDALSTQFWDVLATLYANPVRTPATQLVVRRSAG